MLRLPFLRSKSLRPTARASGPMALAREISHCQGDRTAASQERP